MRGCVCACVEFVRACVRAHSIIRRVSREASSPVHCHCHHFSLAAAAAALARVVATATAAETAAAAIVAAAAAGRGRGRKWAGAGRLFVAAMRVSNVATSSVLVEGGQGWGTHQNGR